MNKQFNVLLNELKNPKHKFQIRFMEKLRYKFNNADISIEFIKDCLDNGLLPRFTYDATTMRRNFNKNEVIKIRQNRLKDELTKKTALRDELSRSLNAQHEIWDREDVDSNLKVLILKKLNDVSFCQLNHVKKRTFKKLQKLFEIKKQNDNQKDQFINLSDVTLTNTQKQFLNLGLNCHYLKKANPIEKKIEIEKLMDNILQLESKHKITINPSLPIELRAEAVKLRGNYKSKILTPELKKAAEELKNNPDIIIKRADKTSMYVIMNKNEYFSKLNTILNDNSKFKKIKKDPSNEIKIKLNKIISQINSSCPELQIKLLRGEYKPGYIYGNVKIHKPNNPLRPIISQIPTATYTISKIINELITPYVPNNFNLKSSKEFLDIINTTTPSNLMASLDVESLFTNVPVDTTIKIMIDTIYNSSSPLSIPKQLLEQLLHICTKESPFIDPQNQIFQQIDGVTMGSPLGVLFANFYLGHIEQLIFAKQPTLKPKIYLRYIDDIFIAINDINNIDQLIDSLQSNSILKFTKELENNNKLPFLDVQLQRDDNSFTTSVYVKPTNSGFCLNGSSECSSAYKESTINAYINRAISHSKNENTLKIEIKRIKSLLMDNNYNIELIDRTIKYKLDKHINNHSNNHSNSNNTNNNNINETVINNHTGNNISSYNNDTIINNINNISNINDEIVNNNNNSSNNKNNNANNIDDKENKLILYYKNTMSSEYKKDEQIIKAIIKKNITTVNSNDKLMIRIYYRNNKTHNLIVKNSPSNNQLDLLKQHHLIYEFKCPIGECAHQNISYIGMTTTTLTRRLTMHRQDGSIKKHFTDKHHINLQRQHLDNNTQIIYRDTNYYKLKLAESIFIDKKQPTLNIQQQNFTILPTHRKIPVINPMNTINAINNNNNNTDNNNSSNHNNIDDNRTTISNNNDNNVNKDNFNPINTTNNENNMDCLDNITIDNE